MATVKYSSNNSGGYWWLSDEDWFNLEAAGWDIEWVKDSEFYQRFEKSERFLGALATRATREGLSYDEAIEEFESVTNQRAGSVGCACCGVPHRFSERD